MSCSSCGAPRSLDLGEATVLIPLSARDALELLWSIALYGGNPAPDPDGDESQRLVHRLETALRLVSDGIFPRVEISVAAAEPPPELGEDDE